MSTFRHHDRISLGCGSASFKYGNYISNQILLSLTRLVFCTKACLLATNQNENEFYSQNGNRNQNKTLQEKEFLNENTFFAFDMIEFHPFQQNNGINCITCH